MNKPQPRRRTGLTLAQDVAIDTYRRVWRIADDSGFDDCWEPEANPTAGSADMDWSRWPGDVVARGSQRGCMEPGR